MHKLLIALPLIALTGCNSVSFVASGVEQYCSLPIESRLANREALAVAIAPNRVQVTCVDSADEQSDM